MRVTKGELRAELGLPEQVTVSTPALVWQKRDGVNSRVLLFTWVRSRANQPAAQREGEWEPGTGTPGFLGAHCFLVSDFSWVGCSMRYSGVLIRLSPFYLHQFKWFLFPEPEKVRRNKTSPSWATTGFAVSTRNWTSCLLPPLTEAIHQISDWEHCWDDSKVFLHHPNLQTENAMIRNF